uniref:EGF-like domain-containing protein n=1 Tax=Vombatus ursinus TaxID=29139 RepID=A0A4X2LNB8_VOMUR
MPLYGAARWHSGRWYLANGNKHCITDNGTRCEGVQFTCLNGRCISERWKCDNDNDCGDGSDELESVCAFTCGNGRCVPYHYRCDHYNDCGDNSDEAGCLFRTCDSNTEFACNNGRCISLDYVCNGVNNCYDNGTTDERNCPDRTCQSGFTKCQNTNICIPRTYLCDGDNDCGDMSDESPTHCVSLTCTSSEFRCTSGRCIPRAWICDGDADCSDAYDEHQNCCVYPPCQQYQFTCQNGRCISKAYLCDGDNDCGDLSDELEHLCTTPEATCPPHQFKCDNGNCIEMMQICNHLDDCGDNSDEKGCGINECNDPSISGCDHNCTDTQTSFYCTCLPGYKLMSDKKTCDDIDECNETPSVCSQMCENTAGSYICKCARGYIREPDGKRCRQNSDISPYLIFSNRYYLRNMTADGQSYSLILQGLGLAVALDFDRVEKRLYWIDLERQVIERMFLNGTNKETVINSNLPAGEGLAVDWVARKLYWLDAYLNCLSVANLDGRFRRKLILYSKTDKKNVCLNRQVYWTDWADRAYIGRVGMDGTNKTVIISTKLSWPNGITIDYTNDKLYWSDAHLSYIEFSDLEGQHRHTVFDGTLPHPFALTIFEDTVFWTDWNTRTVEKGNKYNGLGRMVLVNTTHRPFDIHVYHPYRQPIGEQIVIESTPVPIYLCLQANEMGPLFHCLRTYR